MRSPSRPALQIDTTRIVSDMTQRGWNQAELARKAGINESTVGRFLAGRHQTAKTLAKLAQALGRSPSDYSQVTAPIAAEAVAS